MFTEQPLVAASNEISVVSSRMLCWQLVSTDVQLLCAVQLPVIHSGVPGVTPA